MHRLSISLQVSLLAHCSASLPEVLLKMKTGKDSRSYSQTHRSLGRANTSCYNSSDRSALRRITTLTSNIASMAQMLT